MDLLSAEEFVSAILEMRDNKKAIDGGNPTTKYDGLDVYKRQVCTFADSYDTIGNQLFGFITVQFVLSGRGSVSYTHLNADSVLCA